MKQSTYFTVGGGRLKYLNVGGREIGVLSFVWEGERSEYLNVGGRESRVPYCGREGGRATLLWKEGKEREEYRSTIL